MEIKETELQNILKENKKVLVDCYAPWCGPCRMLGPVIEELESEVTTCKFVKINVDDAEELPKQYGIMSIPTLLFFEDGELKGTNVGLISKDEIKQLIGE